MTSSCWHKFVAHAHVRTQQKWPVQLAQSLTIRHVDNIRLKRDTCHLRVGWHMGEEDTVGDARRDLDERREREEFYRFWPAYLGMITCATRARMESKSHRP